MKNWLRNFGLGVFLGFVIVAVFVWLAYTIFMLKEDPALANAYVATGTLILALVTVLLAFFTYLSVKSGYDREKRERKERLLNEIIEWAEESAKSAIHRQSLENPELWKAKLNYKYCLAQSEYIKELATPSFPTLNSYIRDVVTKLHEAIENTTKLIDSKLGDNYEQVRKSEDELTNLVKELFQEAAKIKRP